MEWSRLKKLLKSYEYGYKRKAANILSLHQIKQALLIENDSPKWLLRKAAVAMAYCGGLREAELRKIEIGNVRVDVEGVWVEFIQAKQRGPVKPNRFLVPRETFGDHVIS